MARIVRASTDDSTRQFRVADRGSHPSKRRDRENRLARRRKTGRENVRRKEVRNDEKQTGGRPNEVGRERWSTVLAVGEPPFIGFPEINTHNSFGTRSRASLLATL